MEKLLFKTINIKHFCLPNTKELSDARTAELITILYGLWSSWEMASMDFDRVIIVGLVQLA
jgi:hypothetical protein